MMQVHCLSCFHKCLATPANLSTCVPFQIMIPSFSLHLVFPVLAIWLQCRTPHHQQPDRPQKQHLWGAGIVGGGPPGGGGDATLLPHPSHFPGPGLRPALPPAASRPVGPADRGGGGGLFRPAVDGRRPPARPLRGRPAVQAPRAPHTGRHMPTRGVGAGSPSVACTGEKFAPPP